DLDAGQHLLAHGLDGGAKVAREPAFTDRLGLRLESVMSVDDAVGLDRAVERHHRSGGLPGSVTILGYAAGDVAGDRDRRLTPRDLGATLERRTNDVADVLR